MMELSDIEALVNKLASLQEERGDFLVYIDENSVSIAGYTGKAKWITIPEEIDGLPVTGISDSAFSHRYLTGVTLPGGITRIGCWAFSDNCLTRITIPPGVTWIGIGAFQNNLLTGIRLPGGIRDIPSDVFFHNLLSAVSIPGSVTAVDGGAFFMNDIRSVVIDPNVALDRRSFLHNFAEFYNDHGKQGGTYRLEKGWVFNPGREETDSEPRPAGGPAETVRSGPPGKIRSVAYCPDNRYFLSGEDNGFITLWNAETRRPLWNARGPGPVITAVFSPECKRAAAAFDGGTIRIYDLQSGEEIAEMRRNVRTIAFSGGSRRLFSGSSDGVITVWDSTGGTAMGTTRAHAGAVRAMSFSLDRKQLATGSEDALIKLWEPENVRLIKTLSGHADEISSLAYSPDRRFIVSGSGDGVLIIWDAETGEALHSLRGHSRRICSAAFSPGGDRVISASGDGTVKIWDPVNGTELMTLGGHAGAAFAAASPDNRIIVSGSGDGTIRIWDAGAGTETACIRP
jgi:hypothetical protein